MYLYVHSSTIHNSQDMETTECPSTDEWVKKMGYIYSEILLSHKKDKIIFATTWMQLEILILSEINQAEKDKYHVVSLICEI